jgi:hypothetical protein
VERSHGPVAGLLEPGLGLHCADHGEQPADAARDAALTASRDRLPRARRCRLRRVCCGACGARLVLPTRRTRRSLTVDGSDLPVHTVHLDVPLTRCPDCGIEHLPWGVDADLETLLRALYGTVTSR